MATAAAAVVAATTFVVTAPVTAQSPLSRAAASSAAPVKPAAAASAVADHRHGAIQKQNKVVDVEPAPLGSASSHSNRMLSSEAMPPATQRSTSLYAIAS